MRVIPIIDNPILYVIMGPNGSGKSTFGYQFVKSTNIFDTDDRIQNIEKHYKSIPRREWPEESNYFETDFDFFTKIKNDEFRFLVNTAMENQYNFAFETPFSYWGQDCITEFKNNNYSIIGYFFGLDSIIESIKFVNLRTLKGGHDLSLESIKYNFENSYINICTYAHLFNEIHFVRHLESDLAVFASYTDKKINLHGDINLPEWVNYLDSSVFLFS